MIDTFEKTRIKYCLSIEEVSALLLLFNDYVAIDQFGEQTICNIDFDINRFSIAPKSQLDEEYKEKMYLCSYGIPTENDVVFLGLKKEYDGVVYNQQLSAKLIDIKKEIALCNIKGHDCVSLSENLNSLLHVAQVSPCLFLAKERTTYSGKKFNLKLTIDKNIRYRLTNLDLTLGDNGTNLLKNSQCVVELQTDRYYITKINQKLAQFNIYPCSCLKVISKSQEEIGAALMTALLKS